MCKKSFLVAGLGNIGVEYALTRHNIGFMVLDVWAQASNTSFHTERYGDLAVVKEKGREFYLLKPSTYMNLSGNALRYWVGKLKMDLEQVMVICDDLNLPFGTVRMRQRGSDGGHNGLKNIALMLETCDYPRCRIGVGHDFQAGEQINFVLGRFSSEEEQNLPDLEQKVIQGIKLWGLSGIEAAMTFLNSRPKKISESTEPVLEE